MFGGGRNRKKWHEMTRREIVSALAALTLIGGAIVAAFAYQVSQANEWSAWMLLWPLPAMLGVVAMVGTAYAQAVRELRRRKESSSGTGMAPWLAMIFSLTANLSLAAEPETTTATRLKLFNECGHRVRGFSKDDSTPMNGDSLQHTVALNDHDLRDSPLHVAAASGKRDGVRGDVQIETAD